LRQLTKGTRYYRLRCFHQSGDYAPSDFPVTYLYLGAYTTDPTWNYTNSFKVLSVKNSSLVNTSFEALFTRYSDTAELRPSVTLQSSASASFDSYETSEEGHELVIRLKGNNFGPAWTCPTWLDLKYAATAGVRTLTGSDQKGVQYVSQLQFAYTAATARYGTTVSSYSINIAGGFSAVYTPAQMASKGWRILLDLSEYYRLSGDVTVIFTVEDSRSMTTSFTRTVKVVSYKPIYLTANDTHRQGGTGSTVLLSFSGAWHGSPLTLTCQSITAYEEGSSAVYASFSPPVTVSGTSFSYAGAWSGVSFDPKKAYTISAVFTDTVVTVTLILPIPVGTPVLSIRDGKVGVNNPSPSTALDVIGTICQNGYPVIGYTGEIKDEIDDSIDLNDYVETGIYVYSTKASQISHFPGNNSPFLLEVIACSDFIVQKLFYIAGGAYVRTYYNQTGYGWSAWRQGA
ncbi:MAG: hypothetical protein IJ639_03650, partial [Ruminococcus sp.]|nr:hypothetical protein [Ruminococcus sp.]